MIHYVLCSDFLIYNLIEQAIPVDLFHLKYVSKFFYNNITNNDIEKMIILNIHKNLEYKLGTYYTEFIQNLSTKKMMIAGDFIMECILGIQNSKIDVYSYEFQHTTIFDILPSLENIFDDAPIQTKNIEKLFAHIPIEFKSMNYNYITLENAQKHIIYDNYSLNISKNIFSIVNNKTKLYIHNLNKIMNKTEILRGNKLDNNNFYLSKEVCISFTKSAYVNKYQIPLPTIQKYVNNGFNFRYELNYVNCFQYDNKLYHFLVYKNMGNYEKYSFLGKVFDTLFLVGLKNKTVQLSISDVNNLILNVNDITKTIFSDNKIKTEECNCKLKEYFNIKHEHTECKITSVNRNKDTNLILINFNDLNKDLKDEYFRLFDENYKSDRFLNMNRLYAYKI